MELTRKTWGSGGSAQNKMSLTRMIKRKTCLFFDKLLLCCNFYSLPVEVRIFFWSYIPRGSNSQATCYCSRSILRQERLKSICIRECNASLTCISLITRTPVGFHYGRYLRRCKKDYRHSYRCDPINVPRAMKHSSNYDSCIHSADILLIFCN